MLQAVFKNIPATIGMGLRFNDDLPSCFESTTSIVGKTLQPFKLLSLPLYLVEQAERLLQPELDSLS